MKLPANPGVVAWHRGSSRRDSGELFVQANVGGIDEFHGKSDFVQSVLINLHVAPLQGSVVSPRRVPRALPWAGLLQPLRGKESVFRRPPHQDVPESVSRLLQVRRARKPDAPELYPPRITPLCHLTLAIMFALWRHGPQAQALEELAIGIGFRVRRRQEPFAVEDRVCAREKAQGLELVAHGVAAG